MRTEASVVQLRQWWGEIRPVFNRHTAIMLRANLARPVRSRLSIAADTSGRGSAPPQTPREELDVLTLWLLNRRAAAVSSAWAVVKNMLRLQSPHPSFLVCCGQKPRAVDRNFRLPLVLVLFGKEREVNLTKVTAEPEQDLPSRTVQNVKRTSTRKRTSTLTAKLQYKLLPSLLRNACMAQALLRHSTALASAQVKTVECHPAALSWKAKCPPPCHFHLLTRLAVEPRP